MPRIRTLKPEFWSDEKMGPLDPLTRLVFLGLISHADDAGRLVDSVRQLDGLIFPYSEDTCAEALEILARLSRVSRYTSASGQKLIQIEGWTKHQRVDKPAKYTLPPPPVDVLESQGVTESSRDPRDTLARSSRSDLRPTTNDLRPTTNDQGPTRDLSPSEAGVGGVEQSAGFQELWSAWGTGNLLPAERAYYRAVPDKITHAELIERRRRYVERVGDPKYVKYLARWIDEGGYADPTLAEDTTDPLAYTAEELAELERRASA